MLKILVSIVVGFQNRVKKTSRICVEPSTTVLHFSVFFKFASRLFAVLISHSAVRDHVHMNYSYAMSPELLHVDGY